MKKIPLRQGKFALVDDEDHPHLSKFKWFLQSTGGSWVVRRYSHIKRNQAGKWISQYIPIADEILGKKDGMIVDHRNSNPLDNRRENLRFATPSQNNCNKKVQSNSKTRVKGVWVNVRDGYFYSQITVNGKRYWVGSFRTLDEAACAYDQAARERFGEFAKLNNIKKEN